VARRPRRARPYPRRPLLPPILFGPGTADPFPYTAATYQIAIDWDDDGDFTGTGEDVTTRVLADGALSITYGRDQARSLAPIAPGQTGLELDNTSRDYSPQNASSPLYGQLRPGHAVRIQATLDGVTYGLFSGHLDDYEVLPNTGERMVRLTAQDVLAALGDVKISTGLHQGVSTGQAIGLVLDAIGWPAGDRDIDHGGTTIAWWWEEGTDAFTALQRIVASEGPGAFAHAGSDGRFVFRDRHHRLIRDASLTVQATFRDAGDEPLFSAPMSYEVGWRDIVNSVSLSVEQRQVADLGVVWEYGAQVIAIPAGDTIAIAVETSDPFRDARTPEEDTDYTVISGTVAVTLSRTSGQSAVIRIRAIAGAATIEKLQLRASSLQAARTVQILAEDTTSISRYGTRSSTVDAPWVGVHDADAIAALILAQRAERLPVVSIRLVGSNVRRLTEQLRRDLSDRVRIVETQTGIDNDFYIEQITHDIREAGLVHDTVFGCEQVPQPVSNPFRFDTAGAGFDDGLFGASGVDDPDTIFRFDVAGAGFDDGLFAY
jgi:hypothetical protein